MKNASSETSESLLNNIFDANASIFLSTCYLPVRSDIQKTLWFSCKADDFFFYFCTFQVYEHRKTECMEKTTDLWQVTDKLSYVNHLLLEDNWTSTDFNILHTVAAT